MLPLGCLGLGEFDNDELRGLIGTYNDYARGVTYATAFAVIKSFAKPQSSDSITCNTAIYFNEQTFVDGYDPLTNLSDSIPLSGINQSQWIVNSIYESLLKTTHFTGYSAV